MARWAPIVALLAGALGGCADETPLAPPVIHYGQDVCAVCGMIISDERFAAGLVARGPDGLEARAFDDVGCLLDDEATHEVAGRWVRAFRQDRWYEADKATYVHSQQVHSPMAFGLAACADEVSARALLAEFPGQIMEFTEARRRFEAGELVMAPIP